MRFSVFCFSTLFCQLLWAGHSHDAPPLEELVVTQQRLSQVTVDNSKLAVDVGELIKQLPGVEINSNGALTSVLQYRGTYGDRVAMHLDHAPAFSGGPNGMDSPLSYVSPLLLKSIGIDRGVAKVSAAQESLGGAVHAQLDRGEFTQGDSMTLSGQADARYNSNDKAKNTALRATLANHVQKITVLAAYDKGDDAEAANNIELAGTQYQRARYDVSYGIQTDQLRAELFAGHVKTEDTGTPALPMDIALIDSDLYGLNVVANVGEHKLSLHASANDVYHEMDNFSLRRAPMMAMQYRLTQAQGDNAALSIDLAGDWGDSRYIVGVDANLTEHSADIVNPNNAAFLIRNFNQIERDVTGLFAELEAQFEAWSLSTGLRYNKVSMSAVDVSASGLPAMMAMGAMQLANSFNQADNDENYDLVDVVLKSRLTINGELSLIAEYGHKNRAPSYQERYLWLPLAATGGLADGRNYTGNAKLKAETADEVNLGFEWQQGRFSLAPQMYYRRINDYIQGVSTTNMAANMLATMMTGQAALMFDNIDAEIYGADVSWDYGINEHWQLAGNLSAVRGKRRDQTDELYRISPLNNRVSLRWKNAKTQVAFISTLVASQNKVSSFNNEAKTAGYGVLDIHVEHQVGVDLKAFAQVNNVFNQLALNHLGGYNRNANSDVGLGQRLPQKGVGVYAGLQFEF